MKELNDLNLQPPYKEKAVYSEKNVFEGAKTQRKHIRTKMSTFSCRCKLLIMSAKVKAKELIFELKKRYVIEKLSIYIFCQHSLKKYYCTMNYVLATYVLF